MRGFQPAKKNYADGGMVSRIKGALGLGGKDDKKKEQAPNPAPSPDPAQAPAPAPAQEPRTALGQYSAGSAIKRRMAEIDSYADGGPVRGPGTGTSDEVQDEVPEGTYIMPTDSTKAIGEQQLAAMGKGAKVPVNLSNGEFKMPPDQVHAVGVQALDAMKNATHTPVAARGFAPGAQQGGEPPLFFADGGVVEDEQKRRLVAVPASMQRRENTTFAADNSIAPPAPAAPQAAPVMQPARPPAPAAAPVVASPNQTSPANIFPQSSPSAGASIYSGVGFSADQFGSSGKFAKVPDTIGRQPGRMPAVQPAAPAQPGMTDAQRQQAIGQIPTGGIASPARVTPVTPSAPAAPAAAVQATNQPLDAQAAADRAKIGAAWDTVKDVNDDAGRAIADVAMMVPRGLAGAYDSAVVRPMRAAGIDAGYISPHLVPSGVDPASMTPFTDQKRMQQATTAAAPAPAAATAGQPPAARPVGESTAGAGRGRINPPLVKPNASEEASTEKTPSKPSATEVAPGVFRSGNSFADSAELAVAGAQPRGLPSAQNIAAADALSARSQQESMGRVQAQMAAQQNAQANGPEALRARGLAMLASRELGSVRRARVLLDAADRLDATTNTRNGQSLEMQRSMLAQQGETSRANARNAIDQGRLDLEQQVRGFDINAGQRLEKLQQKYEAAKTNEERSAIAKQIRDLSGKAEPTNRFTVVPGGQEWDTTAGAMRNVPARVLDNQTGQFIDSTGVQRGMPPPVDSPQVQAIKNNTALTIEQRREELKKLGFS